MNRLLIVEDEKGIRDTLHEILELGGYDVITASNGKEGLQVILDEKPNIVLCDVYMPELDGFELLAEVKKHLKGGVPPIFIFLTARVEKQAIKQGLDLGAHAYINKPFDHIELLETIKHQLKIVRSSEAAENYVV